jgi:hypothetical protein
LEHSKSSLTRRNNADVLIKGGARHAITAGNLGHLNIRVTQKRLYLTHLLVV